MKVSELPKEVFDKLFDDYLPSSNDIKSMTPTDVYNELFFWRDSFRQALRYLMLDFDLYHIPTKDQIKFKYYEYTEREFTLDIMSGLYSNPSKPTQNQIKFHVNGNHGFIININEDNTKELENYTTALHLALNVPHELLVRIVKTLLDLGVDPNKRDGWGQSPLYKALDLAYWYVQRSWHDPKEWLKIPIMLLQQGADISEEERELGIEMLIKINNVQTARAWVDAGCKLYTQNTTFLEIFLYVESKKCYNQNGYASDFITTETPKQIYISDPIFRELTRGFYIQTLLGRKETWNLINIFYPKDLCNLIMDYDVLPEAFVSDNYPADFLADTFLPIAEEIAASILEEIAQDNSKQQSETIEAQKLKTTISHHDQTVIKQEKSLKVQKNPSTMKMNSNSVSSQNISQAKKSVRPSTASKSGINTPRLIQQTKSLQLNSSRSVLKSITPSRPTTSSNNTKLTTTTTTFQFNHQKGVVSARKSNPSSSRPIQNVNAENESKMCIENTKDLSSHASRSVLKSASSSRPSTSSSNNNTLITTPQFNQQRTVVSAQRPTPSSLRPAQIVNAKNESKMCMENTKDLPSPSSSSVLKSVKSSRPSTSSSNNNTSKTTPQFNQQRTVVSAQKPNPTSSKQPARQSAQKGG